jgi:hypothetical protein
MCCRAVSLLLAVIVLEAAAGQAQRVPSPPQRRPAQPRRDLLALPPPGAAITDEQFNQSLFNPVGGADRARARLEARLAWEIKRIDQVYGLSSEQKHKLEVAGRGDIKRLFDDVRKQQERLESARGDVLQYRAILKGLKPLRVDAHLLFIEGSLFAKTLKTTLSPAQRARYEKDRRDFYRGRVGWAVSFLEHRLRLSQDQRDRFAALIVAETHPLRRYGESDFSAILFQASQLPEGKLRPIFDEDQWLLLAGQFQDVKRLERDLVAEGYLPENQPEGTESRSL